MVILTTLDCDIVGQQEGNSATSEQKQKVEVRQRKKGARRRVNIIFIQILIMSHEVLNEALAAPGSNGTCTVSYSGLLYHSTYMPISRAAVRKSDPDTSFLDASCLSTFYGVPVPCSRTRTNAVNDTYSSPILSSQPLCFFLFSKFLSVLSSSFLKIPDSRNNPREASIMDV